MQPLTSSPGSCAHERLKVSENFVSTMARSFWDQIQRHATPEPSVTERLLPEWGEPTLVDLWVCGNAEKSSQGLSAFLQVIFVWGGCRGGQGDRPDRVRSGPAAGNGTVGKKEFRSQWFKDTMQTLAPRLGLSPFISLPIEEAVAMAQRSRSGDSGASMAPWRLVVHFGLLKGLKGYAEYTLTPPLFLAVEFEISTPSSILPTANYVSFTAWLSSSEV
jgi:hypothetical protein